MVGELRRALFAPASLAEKLGKGPVKPEALAGIPFISPVYSYHGQVVPGEESVPARQQRAANRPPTQTVAVAMELAEVTGQAVFAPEIAARPFVAQRRLVEIPVVGWDVRHALFLVCDSERVMASVLRDMVAALRSFLSAPSETRPYLTYDGVGLLDAVASAFVGISVGSMPLPQGRTRGIDPTISDGNRQKKPPPGRDEHRGMRVLINDAGPFQSFRIIRTRGRKRPFAAAWIVAIRLGR